MKKKGLLVSLIVLAILIGSLIAAYWLVNSKPESRKSSKEIRKIGMKAFAEQNSNYALDITTPAKVSSLNIVALGVEVSGKIESGNIPLKTGQTFKKGELLFSINSDDITAKLVSAKSKFITLLSQTLPDIKFDFKEQYDKWQKFFDNISLNKPLPILPEFSESREKVYMAAKNIISTYYDIKSQEISASKHKIYAPFNGTFTALTKEVGAIVSANSQIGTISSTDNLEIIANVSQDNATRIKEGSVVSIKARNGNEHKGKVSRVASYVEQTTQMVQVFISAFEPSRDIIEGELLEVMIPIGEIKEVIKLPVDAVASNGRVYGIKDGKVYFINAEIVYQSGEWCYLKGIKNGEVIVQESIITPIEGAEVNVIERHID